MRIGRLGLTILVGISISLCAWSQAPEPALAEEVIEEISLKEFVALQAPLNSLRSLLEASAELEAERAALLSRSQVDGVSDIEIADIEAESERLATRIHELDVQMTTLVTGLPESRFSTSTPQKMNLEEEFRKLLTPFVSMMQSATAQARETEELKRQLALAASNKALAEQALGRIAPLLSVVEDDDIAYAPLVQIADEWAGRLDSAADLANTVERQLQANAEAKAAGGSGAGRALSNFVTERGRNLMLAGLAFAVVLVLMRLLSRLATRARRARGVPRNFVVRIARLAYNFATVLFSTLAMLVVFNYFNDWLMMALIGIGLLAVMFGAIKTLPALIDQVILLLNLGAVQEDERVVIDGVPWKVTRLDAFTQLENPVLDGGHFTLPVRQLVGLMSRPTGHNEGWFPSKRGDWVKLSDGVYGEVVVQTPELVEIRQRGGRRITYQTAQYLELAPRNLSSGSRIEHVFGIGYEHQEIATEQVIKQMREYVHDGLTRLLGEDDLVAVHVEFMQAGASSLDYEVEADVSGATAPRIEVVEREMARLLVSACNHYGWSIPFQQVVLHQAAPGSTSDALATGSAQTGHVHGDR